MGEQNLLIVGNGSPYHIGSHFLDAATSLGIRSRLFDISLADSKWVLLNKISWRLRQHLPPLTAHFERSLVELVEQTKPTHVLVIGFAPIRKQVLAKLGARNIRLINFATDDPWNPNHKSPWWLESIANYSLICTPRISNLADLSVMGAQSVTYLPFAYSPKIHFPEDNISEADRNRYECDMLFVGGADADRFSVVEKILRSGVRIKLFGGYWDRNPITRQFYGGHLSENEFRKAVACAKINLNMVRRSNRDDHVMRTFELPAMGACILSEFTEKQAAFFSRDAVCYYQSFEEMLLQIEDLLNHPEKRIRFSKNALQEIKRGNHTYADRLRTILELG